MAKNAFAPVTPGEMLKEEFLVEYGLSQNELAKAIGISPNRIARSSNFGGACTKCCGARAYTPPLILSQCISEISGSRFQNTPTAVPSPPNFYSL